MEPHPARWWHSESENQTGGPSEHPAVVCELCPRACRIADRHVGYCFGRRNIDGQFIATVYGRSTGFFIDPIEKKPLYHFLPGTATLSFGTIGCNLGCLHCQNWQTSRCRSLDALTETAAPETIAAIARQLNCPSVSMTYNEPITWAEYAIDTANECRKLGVKTVVVTNGYIQPEAAKRFFEPMDAANVDLKSFRDSFYRDVAGGSLQPVLDTLVYLAKETGVWLEITNLLIPDANDSDVELKDLCDWIATELGAHVPLHFSAFRPSHKMLDRPPTTVETLLRAKRIAETSGLRHVYLGNVGASQYQTTFCGNCKCSLIERTDFGTMGMGVLLPVEEGQAASCRQCGEKLEGRFAPVIGTWGNRRQPVRLA